MMTVPHRSPITGGISSFPSCTTKSRRSTAYSAVGGAYVLGFRLLYYSYRIFSHSLYMSLRIFFFQYFKVQSRQEKTRDSLLRESRVCSVNFVCKKGVRGNRRRQSRELCRSYGHIADGAAFFLHSQLQGTNITARSCYPRQFHGCFQFFSLFHFLKQEKRPFNRPSIITFQL